jgi:poly-gamma-glutamate synthesis protein (capsule biosynthesis protein)
MYPEKRTAFFIAFLAAGHFFFSSATGEFNRKENAMSDSGKKTVTLFLCGDVMTGRGIDQILPHPSDPRIFEPCMTSAFGYVELAEEANGPIARPVDFAYIWGDALDEFDTQQPDLRLINLETTITTSDDYWKGKGINYRMHPSNIHSLTAARIDGCSLANNHVLDWGYNGFDETLATLKNAGIKTAGAGRDRAQAEAPAVFEVNGKGRVLVFSFGSETSGVSPSWAATKDKAGVNFLWDFSDDTVKNIAETVRKNDGEKAVVVVSIHWGGNWGYHVPQHERDFAYRLIDEASVDIIYGHSSHHPKGMEVYKGKLIIFGCGDFLNDYEGIPGHEGFRDELTLMYFVSIDPLNGRLKNLFMTPMQIQNMRLNRATREETLWLRDTLDREGKNLGTRVELTEDGRLTLRWD